MCILKMIGENDDQKDANACFNGIVYYLLIILIEFTSDMDVWAKSVRL